MQLQGSAFSERLTARDQLSTVGALCGIGNTRVEEMLTLVGLEGKAADQVEQLSGGQRPRLSIAVR